MRDGVGEKNKDLLILGVSKAARTPWTSIQRSDSRLLPLAPFAGSPYSYPSRYRSRLTFDKPAPRVYTKA